MMRLPDSFGYSAEEILEKELHPLVCPPELLARYENNFPKFARTGKGPAVGRKSQMEAVRKDGSRIHIEISVAAFRFQGQWSSIALIREVSQQDTAAREESFCPQYPTDCRAPGRCPLGSGWQPVFIVRHPSSEGVSRDLFRKNW